ncbi:MAG: hypothetical protein JOZ90_10630 [Alphaproteobacteria bacterium]|nr:hypothetical protein [Alphaproteobacteria bacterium]MBV9371086.1 hypothetical protein [Alphaproteobacteria bacterium]MBV9901540.1 hypothetical protein [Alphaproteobacteria bacterium]
MDFSRAHAFEALDAVPVHALAEAVVITWRYMPSDGSGISDWDLEDQCDEVRVLATSFGIDFESLACRAEKLVDLLRSPAGEALYHLDGDKPVVDNALLEFAATADADNSNAPLLWERPQAEQEG